MKRLVTVSVMALLVAVAFLAGLKVGFDKGMVHSFYGSSGKRVGEITGLTGLEPALVLGFRDFVGASNLA